MSKVGADNYTDFFQSTNDFTTSTAMSGASAFGTADGGEVWRIQISGGYIHIWDSNGYNPDTYKMYHDRPFLAF